MTRLRLVALLLALLLPLQFSWAAVGEYCRHEAGEGATQHFGHHQHVHHDDAQKSAGKNAPDNDCGHCHTGAAHTMLTSASLAFVPSFNAKPPTVVAREHASAYVRAPDRPQWCRPA